MSSESSSFINTLCEIANTDIVMPDYEKCELVDGFITNPYIINTQGTNKQKMPCMYAQMYLGMKFVRKIVDRCGDIAAILNLLKHALPEELVSKIAHDYFFCSGYPETYTPTDVSYYEFAYKGPMPRIISRENMLLLFKMKILDIAIKKRPSPDNPHTYFILSREAWDSNTTGIREYCSTQEDLENCIKNNIVNNFYNAYYDIISTMYDLS